MSRARRIWLTTASSLLCLGIIIWITHYDDPWFSFHAFIVEIPLISLAMGIFGLALLINPSKKGGLGTNYIKELFKLIAGGSRFLVSIIVFIYVTYIVLMSFIQ